MTSGRSRPPQKAMGAALLLVALLGLRAAYLWWPLAPGGVLRFADHAPLYFTLALAHSLCAGLLGVGLWLGARWANGVAYAWSGVLVAMGTALLLFDPFGRGAAGFFVIASEGLGVVALFLVIRSESRMKTPDPRDA